MAVNGTVCTSMIVMVAQKAALLERVRVGEGRRAGCVWVYFRTCLLDLCIPYVLHATENL